MHLGNIGFVDDQGEAAIVDKKMVKTIAKLLGSSEDALMNALTNRSIMAEGSKV